MLFRKAVLEGITTGSVTLAFRRWNRPTVRAGGTLRTPVGVLGIDAVHAIDDADLSVDDARKAGFPDVDALRAELGKASGGTLYRVGFHLLGDDPRVALRSRDTLSEAELTALKQRLLRLDSGAAGRWTVPVLSRIAGRDGITAGEIAEAVDMDKASLKRRIRQLKDLGLTESLPSGYRISPRGRIVVDSLLDD